MPSTRAYSLCLVRALRKSFASLGLCEIQLNENGTAADTGFSFVLLDVVIVRRRKSQGRALNAPFWLQ